MRLKMNQKKAKMLRKSARFMFEITKGAIGSEKQIHKKNKRTYKNLSIAQKERINATKNQPTLF